MSKEQPQWIKKATEILVRRETFSDLEVLTGLQDLEEDRNSLPIKPLGMELVSKLLDESRGVVIWGPPGAGKTTIREQLVTGLTRVGHPPVVISHEDIVNALEKGKKRKGKRLPILGESEKWGDEQRSISNGILYDEVTNASIKGDRTVIVETVGVGRIDRGVSGLQKVFADHPSDYLSLAVVPDIRIVKRASVIRGLILDSSSGMTDKKIIKVLALLGVAVKSDYPMRISDMGRIIRNRVRTEATPAEIDIIGKDLIEESISLQASKAMKGDIPTRGILEPNLTDFISLPDLDAEALAYAKNLAILLRFYAKEMYRISHANGYTAFNQYIPSPVHVHI